MMRPGDRVLQFAVRSSGRGKGVSGQGYRLKPELASPLADSCQNSCGEESAHCSAMGSPAGIPIWGNSPRAAEFPRKRPNGTFINGPEDRADAIANAVAVVLIGIALYFGARWFYHTYLQ